MISSIVGVTPENTLDASVSSVVIAAFLTLSQTEVGTSLIPIAKKTLPAEEHYTVNVNVPVVSS
jgi:hypothetical protein